AMGDDGAVSDWLNRHELDDAPRLADRIQVAEGWENAVEAVLVDALQAVVVKGLEKVSGWLGDLTHGRVALMQAEGAGGNTRAEMNPDFPVTPLREHVSGQAPEGLLAGVHAVEDLVSALALRGQ